MTIAQLLGQEMGPADVAHPHLPDGKVGIELELEGLDHWPAVAGWNQVPDGSLRDGIEYVFNGPQGGTKALKSIKLMAAMAREHNPQASYRTSTHIHMDVRDMEMSQLELLVMAYTMYEGVMFDHCSIERRYSNFCTPFFLNTYLPRLFTQMMQGDRDAVKLRQLGNWPKYTSLNLKPITSYGSVEFRGSSAFTTEPELLGLAQRMLHIKRVAKSFEGSKLAFIEHLRNTNINEVFPQGLRDGYMPDERLMDVGYANAIGIATGLAIPQRMLHEELQRGMAGRARAQGIDHRVRVRRDTLERYNLFVGMDSRMRITELLQLIRQLRRMRGIASPTLYEFIDRQSDPHTVMLRLLGGRENVELILNQLGIAWEDAGITADDRLGRR